MLPISLADAKVGDRIYAAGYPGVHYTSEGISSIRKKAEEDGVQRKLIFDYDMFGFVTGRVFAIKNGMITTRATPDQITGKSVETDALDAYPGSSGSAVLNDRGELIGLHFAGDAHMGSNGPMLDKKATKSWALSMKEIDQRLHLHDLPGTVFAGGNAGTAADRSP